MSLLEVYDPYVFMFWFWTINEFPYFGLNDSWVCLMRMIHMFLCSGFERSMSFHILVWIMIHEFVVCVWSICFYVLVLNDQWVSIFWFKWSMSLLDAYDPYVFMFWLWIIQEFPYFGLNNDSWVCLMRRIHIFLWSGFERSMSFHILVWIMIHEFVACIQYDPYVFMFWFWTINEFPYFGLNNDSWVCWKRMIHMFLCSGFEWSMSFHILV